MTKLLIFVSEIKFQMQLGHSLHYSLENSLAKNKKNSYFKALNIWLAKLLAGQNSQKTLQKYPELIKSAAKRSLVCILEKGIRGSPIETHLKDFEQELLLSVENEFERTLQLLPIKLLIPLTLFILPAVILLFLVPLVSTLGGL